MLTLSHPTAQSDIAIQRWERDSPEYPRELLDLQYPPSELYAIGSADALTKPRVAIVGTRNSTAYGERISRNLTRALVRSGVSVISGMARGIDAAAHRTAMEEGGNTVAVLGTGIDVPYPVGHGALHRAIAEGGLVVSENPPPTHHRLTMKRLGIIEFTPLAQKNAQVSDLQHRDRMIVSTSPARTLQRLAVKPLSLV